MKNQNKEARCSFCSKPKSEANLLISGIDGYICDSCVDQAHLILHDEQNQSNQKSSKKPAHFQAKVLKPQDLKRHLDAYVVGQDETKKYFLLLYIIITKESCSLFKRMILRLKNQM